MLKIKKVIILIMCNKAIICKKAIFIFFIGCIIVDCYGYHEFSFMCCNRVIDVLRSKSVNNQDTKKNCIHEYNNMNKNSYRNSIYEVKPGDTLFYIAWITGNSCLDLAKNNNIKNINILKIGQILQVKHNTIATSFFTKEWYKKFFLCFCRCHYSIVKFFVFITQQFSFLKINNNVSSNVDIIEHTNNFLGTVNTQEILMQWNWPTLGNVINTFSNAEGGNKGIDISGVFDQPILAAMHGKVIYIGNVLQGYGNLIIIQHANYYFSAYAHNNKVLVIENQKVIAGEQIATMGSSGTYETKLHFEIRYKGKSIDPLCLLPKIDFY